MKNLIVFCFVIGFSSQVFGRSFLNVDDQEFIDSMQNKPPKDHAKVARELVHRMDWTAFATISIVDIIKGYPQLNVMSIADGPRNGKSTGNIYFYMSDISAAAKNLKIKNVVTVLFSNEQDLQCSENGVDPMEPTCARTVISGSVVKIEKNSEEYEFARESFVQRHPAAESWENAHNFNIYKIDIKNIIVLDWYGGSHTIPVEEYFNVKLE